MSAMDNNTILEPVEEMKSDFLSDFWKGFLVALGIFGGIFLFIELTR
jgi:hypothetical protein